MFVIALLVLLPAVVFILTTGLLNDDRSPRRANRLAAEVTGLHLPNHSVSIQVD